MDERAMSVYDHIGELQKRLMSIIVVFVISMVIGLVFSQRIIKWLQQAPAAESITMNAFRLTDAIKVYFEFSFIVAILLTAPVALYHIWAFIRPGLYEKEQKVTLAYIPFTIILFIAGVSFAYFVMFPLVIQFMTKLSAQMGIEEVYGIKEYFRFLFQLTIPVGLVFELPVVIMFFTRLGLITPAFLIKIRKYAYFILLIVAGLITPPDVLSQIIVMIPLIILYEISIFFSKRAYKQVLKAEIKYAEEMQLAEIKSDRE